MSQHDDALRVGNPERERAIGLLNDAFSTGYLDIAEFEERSGVVYTAKTRADLKALVADLPNGATLFPDTAVAAVPAVADSLALPRLNFDVDWATVRRRGTWEVPPQMTASGSMGTLDLDLRTATFQAPVCELHLQVSATTVKLRLGPDQEIRVDVQRSGWSDIKDKAGEPVRRGGPVLVVRGALSAASGLTIKR